MFTPAIHFQHFFPTKNGENCCYEEFSQLKIHQNALAAGALPGIPLGEFFQTPVG